MRILVTGGAGFVGANLCIGLSSRHPDWELVVSGALPSHVMADRVGLSKEELYWRLDFLAGSLTYAMADFGLIKRPADVTETAHRAHAAHELIHFAEAGFRAAARSGSALPASIDSTQ